MSYKNILKDTLEILKRSPLLLAALYLGCEVFQQYFMLIERVTTQLTSSPNFVAILGQLLTSLTEFVFLTMLVPQRLIEIDTFRPASSFINFAKRHIVALTAEGLRALTITILWLLALVLPGLYKSIRLMFVPYVVVADPEYMAGRRDAIKYAEELTKGAFLPLLGIFIAVNGIELVRSSLAKKYLIQEFPTISIASSLGFFLLSLLVNVFLFRYYQLRVKKHSTQQPTGA